MKPAGNSTSDRTAPSPHKSPSRTPRAIAIIIFALLSIAPSCAAAAPRNGNNTPPFTPRDIELTAGGYIILRDALTDILARDAAVPRDQAESAVASFIEMLAMLGRAAENRRGGASVADAQNAAWETREFNADLMKMLAPFGMDNPAKTKNLSRLSRELAALGKDPSEAKVRKVMLRHLSPETTAASIALIRKGKAKKCGPLDYFALTPGAGVNISFSPSNNKCISKEDITALVETHYEKKLPALAAFMGGIEKWINNKDNADKLMRLAAAGMALQKLVESAKKDKRLKKEILEQLANAGVNKDVFLYILHAPPPE